MYFLLLYEFIRAFITITEVGVHQAKRGLYVSFSKLVKRIWFSLENYKYAFYGEK